MKPIKKKYSMLRLLYLCFIGIFIFQQANAQLIGSNANGAAKSDKIIAFTNVNVIPMDKERVLLEQTVIIKGGKIAEMGDAKKIKIPSGAVKIDATGKYLIPGLGDMHTHIQPFNQDTAEAALLLHASYGVTTIRNVDYLPKGAFGGFAKLDGPAILNIRSLANNGKIVSPRIYTSGPWYGTNKGEGEGIPTTGVYQRVKAVKDAGFDFLKVHDESQVSFDSVIAACHSLNFPFMGHAIENMKMDKILNSGYRSIEHLTGYLAQLFEVDGELKTKDTTGLIAKMAKATAAAKIWNCPTYTLYMYDAKKPSPAILKRSEMQYLTDSTFARWERWFNAPMSTEPGLIKNPERIVRFRRLMVKALHEAGAPLLSGTDAPAGWQIPGSASHYELQGFVEAGLSPYEALKTSTYNVADYFGTLKETGTVTVGKRADLVLIDANPLNDISNTLKISGVVLNGRWISKQQFDQMLSKHKRKIPM